MQIYEKKSIISIISRIYAMDDKSKKAIIENAINTGLYYNEDDMSKKYKKIIDGVWVDEKNKYIWIYYENSFSN